MATQRLGFRGTEDLGGGLKAIFQVESALTAGGAASNGFGGRPTFVGLSGNFGTVTLGRQDSPLLKASTPQLAGGSNNLVGQIMWSNFLTTPDTDLNSATADLGLGRMNQDVTADRAINYITPSFGGLTAEVQVGQSDIELSGTGFTTETTKTDDVGVNVKYAVGAWTLNAANHTRKLTATGADTSARKNVNNYVGATYDFGVAKVSLQHATSKADVTSIDAESYNNKGTQLGVQVPVTTAINVFGSVGTGTRTILTDAEFKQTSLQMGATYSLSKRTRLYTVYGQQELKGDNNVTAGDKLKETQFALGVIHTF
jgi:predicted porin